MRSKLPKVAALSNACVGISFFLSVLGLIYISSLLGSYLAGVILFPIVVFSHGRLLTEATASAYEKFREFSGKGEIIDGNR